MAYERKRKKQSVADRSPKEWAWEFLRRNPVYRDAYNRVQQLNEANRIFLEKLMNSEDDIELAESFPFEMLETDSVCSVSRTNGTLGDLVKKDEAMAKKMRDKNAELKIWLKPEYKLSTYLLSAWIDPDETPLSAANQSSFGHYTLKVTSRLLPLPRKKQPEQPKRQKIPKGVTSPQMQMIEEAGRHYLPIKRTERSRANRPYSQSVPIVVGNKGHEFYEVQDEGIPVPLAYTEIAVTIDLELPLERQLQAIKEFSEKYRTILAEAGIADLPRSIFDRGGIYAEYLHILDMLADSYRPIDIAIELKTVKIKKETVRKNQTLVAASYYVNASGMRITVAQATQHIRKKIERALQLRDSGYRSLALLDPSWTSKDPGN